MLQKFLKSYLLFIFLKAGVSNDYICQQHHSFKNKNWNVNWYDSLSKKKIQRNEEKFTFLHVIISQRKLFALFLPICPNLIQNYSLNSRRGLLCFDTRKIWPLLIVIGIQKKILINSVCPQNTTKTNSGVSSENIICLGVFQKGQSPVKALKCFHTNGQICNNFFCLFYNGKFTGTKILLRTPILVCGYLFKTLLEL